MANHQARVLGADRPRGEDEIALLHRQHLAADQACHLAPSDRGDNRGQGDRVRPNQDRHEDEEEDGRDRQHGVDEPHEDVVDPAAVVPGHHADGGAQEHGHRHREEGDAQRDPGAPDEPGQRVAAELVAAQKVPDPRPGEGRVEIDGLWLVMRHHSRERWCQDGDKGKNDDQHTGRHPQPVRPQALPRLVPVALGGTRGPGLDPGGRHVELGDAAWTDHPAFIRNESSGRALRRAGRPAGCPL